MNNYFEQKDDPAREHTLTAIDVPSIHRARRPGWLQKLGQFVVRKLGWRISGNVPEEPRLVVAVAPHTSNWDFILAIFVILAVDMRVNVLMKDSAFLPLIGRLYKKLGFMPVNRSNPAGFVEDIAGKMKKQGNSIVVLTPEGTRSKVKEWKSGFIRIALACDAKILPVSIDYKFKEIGLGTVFIPTSEIDKQVDEIRTYFSHVTPKNPEKF